MKRRLQIREDPGSSPLTFAATTLSVDRYSEVVIPEGSKETLGDYKGNPVLHYGHMTSAFWFGREGSLPIGRAVNLRFAGEDTAWGKSELLYDAEFSEANEFGKTVKGLVEEGILNATSIGFHPRKMGDPILQGQTGITHEQWNLLENSIVAIPANAGSLRRAFDTNPSVARHRDLLEMHEVKLADGIYKGRTTKHADGHDHEFLVEVKDGQIVLGATAYEDNHFHQITGQQSTETADNHKHGIELVLKHVAQDIVAKGLGLPQEVLGWSRQDVEDVKRFLALRDELHKKPQKDTSIEQIAALVKEVGDKFYDAKSVIQDGIKAAITTHVRGTK